MLWCDLAEEINEKQLYQTSMENGLLIMPGFLVYPFGYAGSGHVRLAFSKTSEEEIVQGVKILGEALKVCREHPERKRSSKEENSDMILEEETK